MNVVAAVIKKNKHYLIVQRNKNKHLGLKWEFPGGKVEKNEVFKDALKREIKEELNIEISVQKKIGEEKYKDEKIDILILYYRCSHIFGEIYLNEHEDFKWVLAKDMYIYDFAEADKKFSKKLN